MYTNVLAEFNDMISYTRRDKKFFTGKKIKEIAKEALEYLNVHGFSTYFSKKELETFNEAYVNLKYPLSDNSLYSISWANDIMDELKCYKKPIEEEK